MEAKFILSKKTVIANYQKLRSLVDIVSYSFKTNNEVAFVLDQKTDAMFSMHSFESTNLIKNKEKIIYLAQGWNKKQIGDLISKGILYFIVDNCSDLDILKTYLKSAKTRINLFLRVKLQENTIFTGKYFVFGMSSSTAKKEIAELRNNPSIKLLGIHFHRKTQNISEWDLIYAIRSKYGDILDKIDMVNIGGGIPITYKNSSTSEKPIYEKIKQCKKYLNEHGIKLFLEPGRPIAGPSVKLQTEIIGIDGKNIIVNASIYNSSMDTLLVPLKLLIEGETKTGEKYTIKGNTPCSMDIFRYSVCLKNPKVGNTITFLNAGAYNFTTDFCNLPKLKTETID